MKHDSQFYTSSGKFYFNLTYKHHHMDKLNRLGNWGTIETILTNFSITLTMFVWRRIRRIKTGIKVEKSFILECFFASFTFCSRQIAAKLLALFEFVGFGDTIDGIFPLGKIYSLYVMQKPILFVFLSHSIQIKAWLWAIVLINIETSQNLA